MGGTKLVPCIDLHTGELALLSFSRAATDGRLAVLRPLHVGSLPAGTIFGHFYGSTIHMAHEAHFCGAHLIHGTKLGICGLFISAYYSSSPQLSSISEEIMVRFSFLWPLTHAMINRSIGIH